MVAFGWKGGNGLLNISSESFFRIDSLPYDESNGVYLTYLEHDGRGMKMTGGIPFLWEYHEDKMAGPNLYDEDYTYCVVAVDYRSNCIWLEQL